MKKLQRHKAMVSRANLRESSAHVNWFRQHRMPTASLTLVAFLFGYLQPALAWAVGNASAPVSSTVDTDVFQNLSVAPGAESPTAASRTSQPDLRQAASHALNATPLVGAATPASGAPAQMTSLPKGSASISGQSVSLPSGAATVGGMGESFSAQLTTGVATFNVPILLPAGRGSARPAISLSYSSSSGAGLAGIGWSLAAGLSIARETDRGVPRYDDRDDWHPEQDRFIFGAEELVPICKVSSGVCAGARADEALPGWANGWQYFRARVEGSFMRFFWSPDHLTWRIQTQQGVHYELGMPLDGSGYALGLERNPNRPSEVYRWHVVRQYDSHGAPDATPPQPANLAVYRYTQDGNVSYLADIFYTPPAQLPLDATPSRFAHHVALQYEARNDPATLYSAGWPMLQRLRLKRIDVSSKPFVAGSSARRELVRRYHLSYDATSHASLLTAVHHEGRCSTPISESADGVLPASSCPRLPPTSFEYQRVAGGQPGAEDANGFRFEPFHETVSKVDNSPAHSLNESLTSLLDVNADSLPDLLVTAPGSYGGQHGLFLNQGARSGNVTFAAASRMPVVGVSGVDAGVLSLGSSNVVGLDLDGTASVDLLHMPRAKKYNVFSAQRQGSGYAWVGRSILTASGQDAKIDFTQSASRTAVMDVNGDGLVDVVFAGAAEYQTFFSLGRYPGGDGQFGRARMTGPASAEISNEPVTSCLPWSSAPIRLGDPDVRVAELNGDGLPDLVRLRDGQILYWPGRGNGYWGTGDRHGCKAGDYGRDQHVVMNRAPRFGTAQPGALQLADVNGDGLDDLVEQRAQAVDVYLNDSGAGWTARYTLANVPFTSAGSNPLRLSDINGSGTSDLLWGQAHDYKYIDLAGGLRPYLLTKLHNGIGKTTELEYVPSSRLMVEAAKANQPWATAMPMSVPVVVRVTIRDNLEKVGRGAGRYVTEYSYRDPVYEGRQREFRGFRSAEVRTIGDATQPTLVSRSTHLLGECVPDSFDSCEPRDRWKDAWREPLKGLAVLRESFDAAGVYLSTTLASFELRQLYTGRDSRRVSIAYPVATDVFAYDTANFTPASATTQLPALDIKLQGLTAVENIAVPKRAAVGTIRQRSTSTFDDYGHATQSTSLGCIEGCSPADDPITQHAEFTRPTGDTSGWLYRPTRRYVTSTAYPARRNETIQSFNASGDPVTTSAILSGTLPLMRTHAAGRPVAPAPTNASGGVAAPVTITTGTVEYNAFGAVSMTRAALGRCTALTYDPEYAELNLTERVYGGSIGANGCGDREFVTSVEYDRGWGAIMRSTSVSGQPTRFERDGFGRVIAEYQVNPAVPGQLSTVASATYQYNLPANPTVTPYSIVVARQQDGATSDDAQYHEKISYIDGLGRTIVTLSEADPSAGDGGQYVASGMVTYDAKGSPARAYLSFFWNGNPQQFPLQTAPPTAFTSSQKDAFGRTIATYGLDGEVKAHTAFHALSIDLWDAEDLKAGVHSGTYSTARNDGHGRPIAATERIRVAGVLEERTTLQEYLSTGEVTRIVTRRAGSPDVVRWLRYDSLGRLVLNVEPNTSPNFTANAAADVSALRAWRYAYNDLGDIVGTSDARGCGVNSFYDAAGRLIGEDYSPCASHHADYTAPNLTTGDGLELFARYDLADPDAAGVLDENGVAMTTPAALLWGRSTSAADRASKGLLRYDARGRVTGSALRVTKNHAQAATPAALAQRFAPRWYTNVATYDGANRPVTLSTGARTPELMGSGGKSVVSHEYTGRGMLKRINSSYGVLLQSKTLDASGLVSSLVLGDVANTQRAYTYDAQQRVQSVQTFRGTPELWQSPGYSIPAATEPTQQLLLEDLDFEYDSVNNITKVTDWRTPSEWPAHAKPVTRTFEHDDLYRLTRVVQQYGAGTQWISPFAAENGGLTGATEPKPSPHVAFDQRVLEQRFEYDHLGNSSRTTDDANGFYDRSLGTVTRGTASAGPHQVLSASNRAIAPTSTRKGDLSVSHDEIGNVTGLIVRRDGPCLPAGSSCWQRFHYEWDELGQLSRAVRYDLTAGTERTNHGSLTSPLPTRGANAELRYTYDSGGGRVLKTSVAPDGQQLHTVYLSESLELRQAAWTAVGTTADYAVNSQTEFVTLNAGPVSARVIYSLEDLPTQTSGRQHVFLRLTDHLGSGSILLDRATGELVEYTTYQTYGGTDTDYRPGRWGSFRDPYKFTGKEDDIEVGLQYYGARYLSVGLNRWMSPDPVAIHGLRSDPNPYAYVHGRPFVAVDPDGRLAFLAVLAVAIVVSAAVNASVQADQVGWSNVNWGGVAFAGVAGGAGAAVGGPLGAWAGGAVASTLVGAGVSAAVASGVGATAGAAIGSAAGSAVSYGVGSGLNNAAGWGPAPTWGGVGMAAGYGAASGVAGFWTGAAIASSGAGQAMTKGLTSALGDGAGRAVAAGIYGAAGSLGAAATTHAMTGTKMDAHSAFLAAAAGGVSAAVTTGLMTSRRTDPTKGQLSEPKELNQAREARNKLARQLGTLPSRRRPATVSGGYNTETGEVAAAACGNGKCSEDNVTDQLGGDPSKVQHTEAVRPRPTEPFADVPVCRRCEGKYGGKHEAFPWGTRYRSVVDRGVQED